jgi:hypothetical protein
MNTLEKEDIIDVEEDFSTTKSILRNRKRTTDSKELLLFLNMFKFLFYYLEFYNLSMKNR